MVDKYNADRPNFAASMKKLEQATDDKLDALEMAFEGKGVKAITDFGPDSGLMPGTKKEQEEDDDDMDALFALEDEVDAAKAAETLAAADGKGAAGADGAEGDESDDIDDGEETDLVALHEEENPYRLDHKKSILDIGEIERRKKLAQEHGVDPLENHEHEELMRIQHARRHNPSIALTKAQAAIIKKQTMLDDLDAKLGR